MFISSLLTLSSMHKNEVSRPGPMASMIVAEFLKVLQPRIVIAFDLTKKTKRSLTYQDLSTAISFCRLSRDGFFFLIIFFTSLILQISF